MLLRKASVGKRLGAFLIDHFIFSFAFIFALIIVLSGAQAAGPQIIFYYIFFFAIIILVYGLRDIVKGQSVGKRLLGIGVRDASDNLVVPARIKIISEANLHIPVAYRAFGAYLQQRKPQNRR